MALFQQSVLKKYLNDLNKEQLQQAWSRFTNHFHAPVKQQNIRNAKEEQYQEGFLRELFVEVLGYTLNPSPGFNLTTEYKNEKDSKKADGAILKAEAVTAVIELKGTDTTDLGKVETQAFSYKNNQKGCTYVITSNFEKLRFYINDAVDHVEFNLFTLTEKEFAVLFCCLQADALLNDTALKMKQASVTVEENVTKQLYADYSGFKRKLFHSIASLNTQYDQLTLFKKTQKLLDRFLFILFAEDRLLLPPNSVREILKQWEQLKELDNYVPLYDRFKKYFGYLNTGHQGKEYEIFAFNGGLFAADEILDNIKVEDALLYDATKQLSQYDFETEVDVNILGHIFEHSLTEIEAVERDLTSPSGGGREGASKRKKDGVFYTPRYITKYIVENTVGALCNTKKEELEITDDAFTPQKRKDNTKKLQQKLETYRQWLLQLTICDPACGSGAFLNQALEFLIAEHRYVDTLTAKLFGDTMVLSDVENSILENNLFGVDINEEAVEIARLSLWLRTARKGRKLNNLSNNIKVGNSLIDDPAVAGDKAFNWKNEFAAIFEKDGFDVVIGNPPYVRSEFLNLEQKNYFKINYRSVTGQYDIYILFYELAFRILRDNGKLSFITPNKFLLGEYGLEIRKLLIRETKIEELLDISLLGVFDDASVYPVVYSGSKGYLQGQQIKIKSKVNNIQSIWTEEPKLLSQDLLGLDDAFVINTNVSNIGILQKVENSSYSLKDRYKITRGFRPPSENLLSKNKIDSNYFPLIKGDALSGPYELQWDGVFVNYLQKKIPESKDIKFFTQPKIFIRDIGLNFNAYFDDESHLCLKTIYFVYGGTIEELKALNVLFNSKLFNFYFKEKYSSMHIGGGYLRFRKQFLDELPISKNYQNLLALSIYCDKQKQQHKNLIDHNISLIKLVQGKFENLKITRKLDKWSSLTIKEFFKEFEKQKIKLSLSEQSEWMSYFEAEKAKANQLQQLIDATDKEIDRMVYALYELTEEEIKIVEEGI